MQSILKFRWRKNRIIIVLLSIFLIITSCNKKAHIVSYCGFNYSRLTIDNVCIPNLDIVARYSDDALVSVKFYSKKNLIKQDSVIAFTGTDFWISQSILGIDTFLRVAVVLQDTARTLVFHQANSIYDLAFMETSLTDTSAKVEFFESRTYSTGEINADMLSSIKERYNKFKPIGDYLIINYFYSNNLLSYDVLEFHSYLRGYGKMATEEIKRNSNCMYLDMLAVEDRTIVFLYKQVIELMRPS